MNHKNAKTGFKIQIWVAGAHDNDMKALLHVIINIEYAPRLLHTQNVSQAFYMIVNITFLESYRFNIMDE